MSSALVIERAGCLSARSLRVSVASPSWSGSSCPKWMGVGSQSRTVSMLLRSHLLPALCVAGDGLVSGARFAAELAQNNR
jgi:hypothetical protein